MQEPVLRGIAAVMLGASDFARSTAFYRDTLGLKPAGEVPGEFAFFELGSSRLAVSPRHAKLAKEIAGGVEIVLAVDDVTAAYKALRARGVVFAGEPRPISEDRWGAHFRDPDGHTLSILGPRGH